MSTDDDDWTPADEPVALEKAEPATERLSSAAGQQSGSGEPLWPAEDGPVPDPGTRPPAAGSAARPDGATSGPNRINRSAPAEAARNTKRWVGIGLVVLLLAVVAGLGGTELYLRHQVTSCLSKAFGSLTGAPTTVSLSGRPMLWQAMTKEIPFVEVNSTDGAGAGDGRLHLRVDRITGSGSQSTIGAITGNGYVPFSQVTASSRGQGGMNLDPNGTGQFGGAGQVESIRSNNDGTFDVTATVTAVIIPLPVTVTLRPHIRDGKAQFEVVRASMMAFGIPPDFAQTIVDETTDAMFGSMLKNLTLSKLEVRGEGVEFAVSGANVTVDENLVRPRGNCDDVTTALG